MLDESMNSIEPFRKSNDKEKVMTADWKGLVGKLAPMLGTALGGPLAGTALAAVAKAIGLDDKAEEDQVADVLAKVTPEQMLAIKNAEAEFKVKMAELGFKSTEDLEQIAAGDRANARQREMQVKDWTPRILAYGVTAGFFGLLSFMLRREVPAGSTDVLNVMVGSLGTAWISIVSYYFGSSAGSARKTEIMQQQEAAK